MKCRFCAEDIQDAAIVCKHCHRDLAVTQARAPRWRLILSTVFVLLLLGFAVLYFSAEHQSYLQFADQRTRWHQKCDRYLNIPLTNAEAARCHDELNAMVAYAKRKGWD